MSMDNLEFLSKSQRDHFTQHRVNLEIAPRQTGEGWLLVPDGQGPFPAVLVVYYEPGGDDEPQDPRADRRVQRADLRLLRALPEKRGALTLPIQGRREEPG